MKYFKLNVLILKIKEHLQWYWLFCWQVFPEVDWWTQISLLFIMSLGVLLYTYWFFNLKYLCGQQLDVVPTYNYVGMLGSFDLR